MLDVSALTKLFQYLASLSGVSQEPQRFFPGCLRRVGSSCTKSSSHLSQAPLHRALIAARADDYIGAAQAPLAWPIQEGFRTRKR
jgi:hypothetical protein